MDALKRLKQKNAERKKIIEKERNELFPMALHAMFVMVLLMYELLVNIEYEFTIQNLKTLFFIYIIYNIVVISFCSKFPDNYIIRCAALTVCHSIFIYSWIWHQDKYGVGYIVGLMAILMFFSFSYSPHKRTQNDDS